MSAENKVNDGGAFHPIIRHVVGPLGEQKTEILSHGVSVRELFAGMAMQAIVSNHSMTESPNYDREGAAAEAVRMAEALVAELEKGNK